MEMPAKAKMHARGKLHRTFCAKVKARRIELALTQQDVADALGVTQPSYASIENGPAVPTLTQVERVSKVLRVSPAYLLGAEELAVA